MKKIVLIISIFLVVFLTSCGNSPKREIIRDNPSEEIITSLKLDLVQNGKSLNESIDKQKAYCDVKVSPNTQDSIFYQVIDLNEYLNQRLKQIHLKILYFNKLLPASDLTAFIQEMNNTTYGLTKEKIGFLEMDNNLFGKISAKTVLNIPADYELKQEDEASLIVFYLPTYGIYNDGSQDCTKSFLFVPISYVFTYASKVDSYVGDIKKYQLSIFN